MDKILDIVDVIANENGLRSDLVLEALKECIIRMAKKEMGESMNFVVLEDKENKDLKLTRTILVVNDESYDEELKDVQMPLSQAKAIDPDIQIDDTIEYQIDLQAMSNNAINNIFFDIKNQIQRLNEKQLMMKYEKFIGKIVSGKVIHIDDNENTIVEIDNIRATLSQKNRIKGEKFKVGSLVRAILKYAGANSSGFYMELSRTTPKMIEELLKLEVPEIKDGEVEIIKIARIPGIKAKVLLSSKNPKIDPVGSAVGNKGVRIMAISKELNGENIDCIQYSQAPELLLQRVLSPAKINSVRFIKNIQKNEEDNADSSKETSLSNDLQLNVNPIKEAIVQIYSSEKSKAIGKFGVNIRLANMLMGYEIKLNEVEDAQNLQNLQNMQNIATQTSEEKSPNEALDALASLFKK